jgi:hypothetical protein
MIEYWLTVMVFSGKGKKAMGFHHRHTGKQHGVRGKGG